MAAKRIKRILITGAGFSAPAQLPIQNCIIEKMIEDPKMDFFSGDLSLESIKFLNAYIYVGLFLLNNYGKNNYNDLESLYDDIINIRRMKAYSGACESDLKRKKEWLSKINPSLPSKEEEYIAINTLKNNIRMAIKSEEISVNLEDIFTSFDKSVMSSEYVHKYTYAQMDTIRYSIMRLFSFYFSKGVKEHSYNQNDYVNVLKYIKSIRTVNPVTIITTNWDTLLEEYFHRQGINYDYGFQFPYTSDDIIEEPPIPLHKKILLLKIHGSANWLRCLHCGIVSVHKDNSAANSLFEDNKHEVCRLCGAGDDSDEASLQPEIITPTMIKSLSNRLYSNLWGSASSEIRNSTHIVFLGYSLPIADFDFRYMLQRNVPDIAEIEVVLNVDANPNQTDKESLKKLLPEKRYKDAFPKNIINFNYDGFGKYYDK